MEASGVMQIIKAGGFLSCQPVAPICETWPALYNLVIETCLTPNSQLSDTPHSPEWAVKLGFCFGGYVSKMGVTASFLCTV